MSRLASGLRILIGGGLLVVACNVTAPPRPAAVEPPGGRKVAAGELYRSTDDKVTFALPQGWIVRRELGSVVLSTDAGEGRRNTIAIRSVPIAGDWVERRTPDLVLPATRKVLQGLPGARVTSEKSAAVGDGGLLRGADFELSFAPPDHAGARYERRHVVVVGRDRVIHLVHTASAGSLDRTAPDFAALISSLKEEA